MSTTTDTTLLFIAPRQGVPHPKSGGGGLPHPRSNGGGGYPIPGLDGGGGVPRVPPWPGLNGGGLCGGRYASCVHAGGLSCIESFEPISYVASFNQPPPLIRLPLHSSAASSG